MRTKIIFFQLLMFFCLGYTQTIVKGRITENEKTVSGAEIAFSKGEYVMNAMSDDSGDFTVHLKEGGLYRIKVSLEGKGSYVDEVNVSENTTLDLGNISLSDRVTQLQTVEVIGRSKKDYNSDYSFSSSKIALKNMETTQAISTITKELLSDRQITRLGDVMKNVSGVTQTSFYNNYAIRGVTQQASYRENRLMNGMATSHIFFSQPMMMNVERVEVIKGPASMTFSSTDAGGSINIVTKKPLKTSRKEVSFNIGSFNTIIGALDFTGPLNKDKTLLYRLNIGYENGKSFRDLQFKKAYMIAPTIAYIPNL
jgi:iron complex outermembrane receptor protein